jgi:type II secretory pathway component GspD/PulD (secretin)
MRRVLAYCIFMSLSAAAYAQVVLQFNVQAQPLSDALRIVAAQTNTNILYDPSLVVGRQVEALKVQSTLDDLLTQLLEGSGLKHQYVNEKTVTLVRDKPVSSAVRHVAVSGGK